MRGKSGRSAGIRKRRKSFRTKSEAERWIINLKREYSRRGRGPGERLSELVQIWHELHGSTLKAPYRLTRTMAVVKALGDPIAFPSPPWISADIGPNA